MRKFGKGLLVAFVLLVVALAVIKAPGASADGLKSVVGMASDAAHGLSTFITHLSS